MNISVSLKTKVIQFISFAFLTQIIIAPNSDAFISLKKSLLTKYIANKCSPLHMNTTSVVRSYQTWVKLSHQQRFLNSISSFSHPRPLIQPKINPGDNLAITYLDIFSSNNNIIPDSNNLQIARHLNSQIPTIKLKTDSIFNNGTLNQTSLMIELVHYLKDNSALGIPKNIDDIELMPPSTEPASGAAVMLIKSKKTNRIIAVLKLQQGGRGLQELSMSAASEKILKTAPSEIRHSSNITIGKFKPHDLEDHFYFKVETVAPGKDLRKLIKDHSQYLNYGRKINESYPLEKAIISTARTFSKLHSNLGKKVNQPLSDPTKQKLIESADYDIKTLKNTLLAIERKPSNSHTPLKTLTSDTLIQNNITFNLDKFNSNIRDLTLKYKNSLSNIEPCCNHGDAHTGNVFINQGDYQTTLIDYSTLLWSILYQQQYCFGIGDPGNDIGRMTASMQFELLKAGVHHDEIVRLSNLFVDEYKIGRNIKKGSPEDLSLNTSIEFYKARFFNLQIPQLVEEIATNTENQKFLERFLNFWNSGVEKELQHNSIKIQALNQKHYFNDLFRPFVLNFILPYPQYS